MVGPPKKHFLPLILFTSLFALFFFSYYHNIPSLSISPINLTPVNGPTKSRSPQGAFVTPPSFTFLIKVLAFDRLDSLSRCLRSLAAADYVGDTVDLHVYIDHFGFIDNSNRSLIDQNLKDSRAILDFVDNFDWKFGNKVVHYRTGNVGLQAQWLEVWWPSTDHEFAFVVEDDLEVSPLFYKFVKGVIGNYYYNVSNSSPDIFGVTLQRPRFVPGKHGNKIKLDTGSRLFLYQLVGTWGQILFPRPWKEFRLWYDEHKSKGIKPFLEGMVTTGWYKKMGERIWTPWFIKFIHSSGYFNIYTNFLRERALSVSHRDAGVNYGKTAGPDSKLLDEGSLDFNLLEMPPLRYLKRYDFCFREVLPGRIVRTMDELGTVLVSVQKQQTVLLVNVVGASDKIIRNLLCHFERLSIGNYVLMGPRSDLLFDLARRGHPIIDSGELFNYVRAQKIMSFKDDTTKLMKDMLLKAFVIKKCLENGYHSWVVDANMLFVQNSLLHELFTPTNDFYTGKSLDFFVVRSSSSAQKIWDDVLKKVAKAVNQVSLPTDSRSFVSIVGKFLEQIGVRINRVDERSFGVKIGANSVRQPPLGTRKLVYWSRETGLDLIQKRLEELSLWVVDGDCSCTAVVCNQS